MIEIHPEVTQAQSRNRAVVALESTIISHGMPYPQNLETARQLESDIRAEGAIPATIAVLNGRLKIGLSDDELTTLARAEDCQKLSRADLAVALAHGGNGATTVAATMIGARLAKIEYFATGGIGGVHRGGELSLDISADLTELARTPVTVVCAGAKAILDIPRTLEFLETAGVPVIGYRCSSLPAFWSRESGVAAPIRFDTVTEINRFIDARKALALGGGVLVTSPVPAEAQIPQSVIEGYIHQALDSAANAGISGKAVTPFLLQEINRLSGGASLTSNIALVRHNARLAAQLAVNALQN